MPVNPLPMGSQAAAGSSTDAMKALMARAYGSRGGRRSARKRSKAKARVKRSGSARKRSRGAAKGSTAMKRKMAKLRAMRGKKRR